MKRFNIAIGLGMALGFVCAAESFAAVTWHFNWYCSGCARIGARTTGTGGPFDSRSSCESARAAMQTNMDSRGGGVRAESCYSTGVDIPRSDSPAAPQPNYGRGGYGSPAPQQQYQQPGVDYEQQRREEEARQRRAEEARQAEAERKRREEFAKSRQDALHLLKGVESGELGLKGLDQDNDLRLKGSKASTLRDAPSATKARGANKCPPSQDPAVVALCQRDPNKPITVDQGVVKGKHKFQVSEKTLNNENYVRGFDAIRAGDYPVAVQHFKKAKAELGNDLLVRNGLALAEDLVKMQKRKTRETAAGREFHQGVMSAIHGNYDVGIEHIRKAIALDPGNPRYRDELTFVQGVKTGVAVAADKEQDLRRKAIAEKAFQVAEKSLAAMYRHDWTSAIAILEAALMINPDDRTIKDVLAIARNAERKEAAAQRNRVAAGKGQ